MQFRDEQSVRAIFSNLMTNLKLNIYERKIYRYMERRFFCSPGPATVRKAINLALKGLCMGSADVIPGVSGGTIALITGIYEDLIGALRSIDTKVSPKAAGP